MLKKLLINFFKLKIIVLALKAYSPSNLLSYQNISQIPQTKILIPTRFIQSKRNLLIQKRNFHQYGIYNIGLLCNMGLNITSQRFFSSQNYMRNNQSNNQNNNYLYDWNDQFFIILQQQIISQRFFHSINNQGQRWNNDWNVPKKNNMMKEKTSNFDINIPTKNTQKLNLVNNNDKTSITEDKSNNSDSANNSSDFNADGNNVQRRKRKVKFITISESSSENNETPNSSTIQPSMIFHETDYAKLPIAPSYASNYAPNDNFNQNSSKRLEPQKVFQDQIDQFVEENLEENSFIKTYDMQIPPAPVFKTNNSFNGKNQIEMHQLEATNKASNIEPSNAHSNITYSHTTNYIGKKSHYLRTPVLKTPPPLNNSRISGIKLPAISKKEQQKIPDKPNNEQKKETQLNENKTINIENKKQINALINPVLTKLPISKNPKYTQKIETIQKNISFFKLIELYQYFCKLCIIDLEATGLAKNDKATEIAIIMVENWRITGEQFHVLLNPEKEVRPSAHHLTGYTWVFLSQYQKFSDISDNLLNMIKNYPLVFHNAKLDLKLLNDGLNYHEEKDKLENKHTIIDTLTWIRNIYPDRRHNLKAFCEYQNVNTENKKLHSALTDASLLAECTINLFKKTNKFYEKIDWNNLPLFDFYERFAKPNSLNGLKLFQNIGMMRNFPTSIRYSKSLYNPKTSKYYEAILFPFINYLNELVGVLIKYNNAKFRKDWLYDDAIYTHFYGLNNNAYANLYESSKEIIFFGNIASSLTIQALIFGHDNSVEKNLQLNNNFSIYGLLDIMHLKNLQLPIETKEIYLLVDYNNNNQDEIRTLLEWCIEKYCNYSFLNFFNFVDENINLTGFLLKYKTKDWEINEDYTKNKKRIFSITSYPNYEAKIIYNLENKIVTFQDDIVFDPHTHILIAHPILKIKVAVLRTKFEHKNPIWVLLQEDAKEVEQKLHRAIVLRKKKDIDYVEKNELARSIYENGRELTEDCSPSLYLKKRGISPPYPKCFRYMENVYHPWLQENFPLLLVPLYDQNRRLVGINRIFCREDGGQLPRKYPKNEPMQDKKIPTKLSIGLTVGAATEIYASSIDDVAIPNMSEHPVIFISEGTENSLIAANTFRFIAKNNKELAKRIYEKIGITTTFAIKACVGINGIIDTPLDKITHTVVILADPDFGTDAKRTMRLTIESFLQKKIKVLIVTPNLEQYKTMDLNDIFLATKNYEKLAEIIEDAVEILNIDELGNDYDAIQNSIANIKRNRNIYKNFENQYMNLQKTIENQGTDSKKEDNPIEIKKDNSASENQEEKKEKANLEEVDKNNKAISNIESSSHETVVQSVVSKTENKLIESEGENNRNENNENPQTEIIKIEEKKAEPAIQETKNKTIQGKYSYFSSIVSETLNSFKKYNKK